MAFRTDSRNIRARWTTVNKQAGANSTLIFQRGLDLYIRRDGKWVFAGVGVPKNTGTEHEAPLVENMDTTMKECLLYLPIHDGLTRLEIGTDQAARLEAAPRSFPPPDRGDRIEHHPRHLGKPSGNDLHRPVGPHFGIRIHQPRCQRAMQARRLLRPHRGGDPGRRLSVRRLLEPLAAADRRAAGAFRATNPRKPSHDAADIHPDCRPRKRELRPPEAGIRSRQAGHSPGGDAEAPENGPEHLFYRARHGFG